MTAMRAPPPRVRGCGLREPDLDPSVLGLFVAAGARLVSRSASRSRPRVRGCRLRLVDAEPSRLREVCRSRGRADNREPEVAAARAWLRIETCDLPHRYRTGTTVAATRAWLRIETR